jgi:hypothetical protein
MIRVGIRKSGAAIIFGGNNTKQVEKFLNACGEELSTIIPMGIFDSVPQAENAVKVSAESEEEAKVTVLV